MPPVAQAVIMCGSPGTGVYKRGDIVLLSIAADGSSPVVDQVTSLTATLFCNSGTTTDVIDIKDPKMPLRYVIPSVGNYTNPEQTNSLCPGSAFHFSYSGTYAGALNIPTKFGPAKCLDMKITPDAYYTPPPNTTTTVPPTTVPTTLTTTTKTTTATSTTPSPSETPQKDDGGNGKPSTAIIVSVVIAVILIVAFLGVAIYFRVKRQKRKRMESAIMPWSNKFSKMSSSMEEDRPSPSGGASSAAAAAAAELGGGGSGAKTPPKPPQLHASGGNGYYDDDSYARYGQQNNRRQPHGAYYENQGGYNNPQEGYANHQDDYYNSYYAQQTGGGGGGYQGADNAVAYGYVDRGGPQDHRYASQGANNPYSDPLDPYPPSAPHALNPGGGPVRRKVSPGGKAAAAGNVPAAGYYPPPPPIRGPAGVALRGPTSMEPPTPNYGQLNTVELILPESAPLPVLSGPVRAPQGIPEPKKKGYAADAEMAGIPMEPLPSHPQVCPPEKRGPAANVEMTSIPMHLVPSHPHT
ncbi:hypothetical protein BGW39_000035 [Mortierella sp. 14UC]|nr:hypothetical protein BGW39_000035 [Mortierella sp. 14UC]